MPTTLDATAGGANANTYATRAEANTYHDDRPANGSTTWSGASDDNKDRALLFAAKLLDSLVDWSGWVTDEDQALMWPRTGLLKRNGYTLSDSVVPQELKDAQAEYARQLLEESRTDDDDIETKGITHLTAGPVSLDFKETQAAKVVPDAVVHLLVPSWYARVRGRAQSTRPLARA